MNFTLFWGLNEVKCLSTWHHEHSMCSRNGRNHRLGHHHHHPLRSHSWEVVQMGLEPRPVPFEAVFIPASFSASQPHSSWPWCIKYIYPNCGWIQFVKILLRIFAFVFMRDMGLQFPFLVPLVFTSEWCWPPRKSWELFPPAKFSRGVNADLQAFLPQDCYNSRLNPSRCGLFFVKRSQLQIRFEK